MKHTSIIGATILTLALNPAFAEKGVLGVQLNTKESLERVIGSKLTSIRTITGPASSKVVFYKDHNHVWNRKFQPRKDIDAKSLGNGPMPGCYGNFIADKAHLYDNRGKSVPGVNPNSRYIGAYSKEKLGYVTLSVYEDDNGYWTIPAHYTYGGEKPKKLKSLKGLHKADMSCD